MRIIMNAKPNESTFYDVVGIGNAIVDVMGKVGERFLSERDLPKGGMVLLDALSAGKIYQDIMPEREVSGGSAANTIAGMASLGVYRQSSRRRTGTGFQPRHRRRRH